MKIIENDRKTSHSDSYTENVSVNYSLSSALSNKLQLLLQDDHITWKSPQKF